MDFSVGLLFAMSHELEANVAFKETKEIPIQYFISK